jgi:hydrogenase maturation protein HypF
MGRLFDAVSALLGLRTLSHFEGQAAMELEFQLQGRETKDVFEFKLSREEGSNPETPWILDWEPMIRQLRREHEQGISPGILSAKFHNTLAEMVVVVAHRLNEEKVVLSGGCFQNEYLTEQTVQRLRKEGFRPYWHQRVPPNDGGIALGQIAAAARERKKGA